MKHPRIVARRIVMPRRTAPPNGYLPAGQPRPAGRLQPIAYTRNRFIHPATIPARKPPGPNHRPGPNAPKTAAGS